MARAPSGDTGAVDVRAAQYTHHAGCGCTFDQEDAPVVRCPAAQSLADERRRAMEGGSTDVIRRIDAEYHRHLAGALAEVKD